MRVPYFSGVGISAPRRSQTVKPSDQNTELFLEGGHDRSHLFGFGHQERIHEFISLFLRHETELDAGGVVPEEVECVCSLVRTVLRENMLSAFRADALGLEAFVTCPSEGS